MYLSQYQLLPYKRIKDYFTELLHIPLSEGSLYNFNCLAYEQLAEFERIAKQQLAQSSGAHTDETGININGKRQWLHSVSNKQWTNSTLMKKEEQKTWMPSVFYLGFMVFYVMINETLLSI